MHVSNLQAVALPTHSPHLLTPPPFWWLDICFSKLWLLGNCLQTHTHTIIHKMHGLVDLKHVMSPFSTTLWQLVGQILVARYALVETRSDTSNTCLMAPCDTFEVSGNLNELKLYVFSSNDLLEEAWVRAVGQNLQCRNTTCSA